jgi:hypothetical protein
MRLLVGTKAVKAELDFMCASQLKYSIESYDLYT